MHLSSNVLCFVVEHELHGREAQDTDREHEPGLFTISPTAGNNRPQRTGRALLGPTA
ncbi:hypothetical protein [Streptomyces sp. NBC_01320]|uniref:hypothetical protein n=1 Tax=Streptomyces sp. NBC_01320 TaxID=2903824 RepID=UPI002E14D080|nr:hypothetical protein OG395_13565 [Streptomyces sp. NBC_01320]